MRGEGALLEVEVDWPARVERSGTGSRAKSRPMPDEDASLEEAYWFSFAMAADEHAAREGTLTKESTDFDLTMMRCFGGGDG